MDGYDALFSASANALDEAPLDLVFAQHYLQKLGLVSPHNLGRVCEYIRHQLDTAESQLTCGSATACADKYLAQIAEARRLLDATPH
jgi:hypothetical protein